MKGWHSHTVCCAEHWVLFVKAPITGIYFFYPESFLVFFVMSNNNRTKAWVPVCPSFLPGLFQNTPALSPCIHSNPGNWMSSLLAPFSLWSLFQCPSGSQSCLSISNTWCFLKMPSELVLVGFSCSRPSCLWLCFLMFQLYLGQPWSKYIKWKFQK